MQRTKPATREDVARRAGVSTATVSRVLNFDQTLSITARKRQAIIETAEAMNYATPRARNRAKKGEEPLKRDGWRPLEQTRLAPIRLSFV